MKPKVANQEKVELQERIGRILHKSRNKKCADCSKKRPTCISFIKPQQSFALGSKVLASFVCIECAGVHRTLGTHICFVRNILLDELDKEEVDSAEFSGNKVVNGIFEGHLKKATTMDEFNIKPLLGANPATRERFIRQKYVDLYFYRKSDHYKHIGDVNKIVAESRKATKALHTPDKKIRKKVRTPTSPPLSRRKSRSRSKSKSKRRESASSNELDTRQQQLQLQQQHQQQQQPQQRNRNTSRVRTARSKSRGRLRGRSTSKTAPIRKNDQDNSNIAVDASNGNGNGNGNGNDANKNRHRSSSRSAIKVKVPLLDSSPKQVEGIDQEEDIMFIGLKDETSGIVLVFDEDESRASLDSRRKRRGSSQGPIQSRKRSSRFNASNHTNLTKESLNNDIDNLEETNVISPLRSKSESHIRVRNSAAIYPLANPVRDVSRIRNRGEMATPLKRATRRRDRSRAREISSTLNDTTDNNDVLVSPEPVVQGSASISPRPRMRRSVESLNKIDRNSPDECHNTTSSEKERRRSKSMSGIARKLNVKMPLQEKTLQTTTVDGSKQRNDKVSPLKARLRRDRTRSRSMSALNLKVPLLNSSPKQVKGIDQEEDMFIIHWIA